MYDNAFSQTNLIMTEKSELFIEYYVLTEWYEDYRAAVHNDWHSNLYITFRKSRKCLLILNT